MITHSPKMVAPCGINCTYCYVHHKKKKPCAGCNMGGDNKPLSCQKCKIKQCVEEQQHHYCYECKDFPCKLLKRLDKSYQIRYQESLIKNLKCIQSKGLAYFLDAERLRFTCPECGHEVNIHDKICCHCSSPHKNI